MNTLEKLQYQNRSAATLKEQKRFVAGNSATATNFFSMETSSVIVRFHEDEHAINWELEVPGLSKENVNVRLDGHWIVISENRNKNSKTQSGRKFFHQTLRVPSTADSAKTTAVWSDGILKISMIRMKPKSIRRTIPVMGVNPAGPVSIYSSFWMRMKEYVSGVKDAFEKFRMKYTLRNGYSKFSM